MRCFHLRDASLLGPDAGFAINIIPSQEGISLVTTRPDHTRNGGSGLKPDVVVLVCSEDSFPEADRIMRVVAESLSNSRTLTFQIRDMESQSFIGLRAALGLRSAVEPLARPDEWREDTLGATLAAEIGDETGFILDYTGGTKVMVSCLVEFHTVWHGRDRADLRCYVAGRDDGLRFANRGTSADRLLPLSTALTLEQRAHLNGYSIGYGWARTDPAGVDVLGDVVAANRNRRNLTVAQFNGEYRDVHFTPVGWSSREEKPNPRDIAPDKLNGAIGEALLSELAVQVSTQLVARMLERQLAPAPVEVLLNATAVALEASEKVAEFDLVWRVGNTVMVGESKRTLRTDRDYLDEQIGAAATRALMSPEIFGDAITNIYWVVESSDADLGRAVEGLVRTLGKGPDIGYGAHWQLKPAAPIRTVAQLAPVSKHLKKKVDELLQRHAPVGDFDPWTRDRSVVASPTELSAPDGDVGPLFAVAGDSPLAVLLATRFPVSDRVLFMSKEQRNSILPYLGDGVAVHELQNSSTALAEPSLFAQFEARAVRLSGNPVLYATPGTKAATAALTAFGLSHGADLLHVDGSRDAIVARSGREDLAWSPGPLPWRDFLTGEANIRLEGRPSGRPITGAASGQDDTWRHQQLSKVLNEWADQSGLDLDWVWPWIDFAGAATPAVKRVQDVIEMQLCPDAIALHDRQVSLVHAYFISEDLDARVRLKTVRDFMKQRTGYGRRLFGDAVRRTIVVAFGRERDVTEVYNRPPFTIMTSRERAATTKLIALSQPDTVWREL